MAEHRPKMLQHIPKLAQHGPMIVQHIPKRIKKSTKTQLHKGHKKYTKSLQTLARKHTMNTHKKHTKNIQKTHTKIKQLQTVSSMPEN